MLLSYSAKWQQSHLSQMATIAARICKLFPMTFHLKNSLKFSQKGRQAPKTTNGRVQWNGWNDSGSSLSWIVSQFRWFHSDLMDQIGAGVRTGVANESTLDLLRFVTSAIFRIATVRLELNGSILMTTILIVLVFLTQHDHWIRPVIQIVETLRATKRKRKNSNVKFSK